MASPSSSPPPPLYRIPALESMNVVLSTFSSSTLHARLLPISALTLIHALRVSYATCQVQGGPRKVPLLQSVALVWILLFGGWTIICLALAQPTPLFDGGVQWTAAVYGSIHAIAVLSGLQKRLLKATSTAPATFGLGLDIFFHLVDAVCRTEGIIALGINPVRDHPSPLTPLITSALIGGGGPLLIGLLDLESPNWRLQTPTWLRKPTGLLAVDIWSAGVVALVYDSLTSLSPIAIRLFGGSRAHAAAKLNMTGKVVGGDRPLLDVNEARLVASLLLFALLSLNRLRVFVTTSKPLAASAAPLANGTPKKGGSVNKGSQQAARRADAASGASSSSTTKMLLGAAVAVPVGLIAAQWLLAGNDLKEGVLQGLTPSSKILILLAHPDDEVMFFSPLILSLLSSLIPAANVFGISACVGSAGGSDKDAGGLGATRVRELVEAYEMLGVPRANVLALDVPGMQDGMREQWEGSAVVEEVTRAIRGGKGGAAPPGWPATFDFLVTFDSAGVSGHANHRSVAEAADGVASRLGSPHVLRLTSLPWWAKYGGLPYALLRRLRGSSSASPCSYALSSPAEYTRAAEAMQAHASQLVWFRYGWWALSSYVFGVEVCSSAG